EDASTLCSARRADSLRPWYECARSSSSSFIASTPPLPRPPPLESPPSTAPTTAAGSGGAQTRSATLSRSALASHRSLGVSFLRPEARPPLPSPPTDLGGPSNSPAQPVPLVA
ncbi:unnamed protein product, partial [Ectocarpus sp. 8 AP-2014]